MASAQNPQALLEETGWIHALARQLVADPHLAADVAQETTVHALERQPDSGRPLRGWLATVMRNQLLKLRRGERNRAAREEAARRPESEPATLEVVERAETHRNVVLSVLALEEPYRSTLLLRFFEQLSYDEIARRTGVTRAAVNSRVTRGLAELRNRLENTYGGDRRALCIALIPLAKLPTGVAVTTIGTFLGLKTMHLLLGTAAATLLAATVSINVIGGREPVAPGASPALAARPVASEEVELQAPQFVSEFRMEPAALPVLELAQQQREKQRVSDQETWKAELYQATVLSPTVEALSVNSGAGDVEVRASASGKLEIQATVHVQLARVKPAELTQVFEDHVSVVEEDGRLVIEDAHQNSRGWSVDFVVSVPGLLPIAANSGSGDVVVSTGRGGVKANTGSGDVRVEIATERLQSLGANSGSGDVRVDVLSIEEELDANSGSGDVAVRVGDPSSPGTASLNSGAGDVSLIVPANVVGSFDLETHAGDLRIPRSFGITAEKDIGGGNRARGTLGSGGGKYKLRSGAGDLSIEIGNALPTKER